MNKYELGRRIKIMRLEQNFTTNMLAAACDKNPVFIRQIESGSRAPSLSTLITLCNTLQVSPAYLLEYELKIKNDDELENTIQKIRSLSPKQLDLILPTVNVMIENID